MEYLAKSTRDQQNSEMIVFLVNQEIKFISRVSGGAYLPEANKYSLTRQSIKKKNQINCNTFVWMSVNIPCMQEIYELFFRYVTSFFKMLAWC